jgi:hypothetical protein
MIQAPKKGEYVVVQTAKESGGVNKPQLLKIVSVDKLTGDFSGRLELDPHLKEVHLACRPQEALANLGKSPRPGKVYGYDLARLFLRTEDDGLHLFCDPEPADLEKLRVGIDRGNSRLAKKGFKRLASACDYVTEVVPKTGKYAGMYTHSRNAEKSPHRVELSVGSATIEGASVASYTYVFLHEHCHAIHFQLLADHPNLNAQWVKLFTTSVNSRNLGTARLTELGKAISGFEGSVKEFMTSSDEEAVADVKLVFRWLRENRNLAVREIEVLKNSKSAGAKETLELVWPYTSVRSKKLKPVVTEYACKSFRELFAEACSLYLLDKELPASISALAEKSLSLANQLAASK